MMQVNLEQEILQNEKTFYLNVMEKTLKDCVKNVEIMQSLKDEAIIIYSGANIKAFLQAIVEQANKLFYENINKHKEVFISGCVGCFKLKQVEEDCFNKYMLYLIL